MEVVAGQHLVTIIIEAEYNNFVMLGVEEENMAVMEVINLQVLKMVQIL